MDDNKIKENISNNIKFLRTQKKISQKQLGSIVNYGDTAVSNWEKGLRTPEAIDLYKLANYFGVSFEDIMCKELKKEQYQDLSNEKAILDNVKLLSEEEQQKVLAILELMRK